MNSLPRKLYVRKFEREGIVLEDRESKQLYSYCENCREKGEMGRHPIVVEAVRFESGVIYPVEMSSLRKQLDEKMRFCDGQSHFSE